MKTTTTEEATRSPARPRSALRLALRQVLQYRSAVAAAVLQLTVCIGANSACVDVRSASASEDKAAHAPAGGHGAAQPAKPSASGSIAPVFAEHKRPTTPDEIVKDLVEGNRRFVDGSPLNYELVHEREHLAGGQHPEAIVLSCSDSRVPPELVFDKSLGDLFVVRTAGNVTDRAALGSIEYAVEHLHVPVLVVMGHEKCGAVAAAASRELMPTANLQAIVLKIAPALAGLTVTLKGAELAQAAIEPNVHVSVRDILRFSSIVRDHVKKKKLRIVHAVYRMKTGEVSVLD